MNVKSINVDLGDRSYDISIAADLISSKPQLLVSYLKNKRCFIISDSNVYPLYKDSLSEMLNANLAVVAGYFVFKAGEASKTLTTVEKIYHEMLSVNLDRKSIIIALGGGVVGDIAGFAAATYMRGIEFIQIPTSLLAMVDSSVGGKTGVDMPEGKNLVGAFWQPKHVLVDINTLKTLPERELKAGLAEIVKYGVILDKQFFDELIVNVEKIKKLDSNFFIEIIAKCCVFKADIVKKDEKESGLRGILNFGHTFGHAIEAVSGFEKYVHGEAVGIGMLMAGELSVLKEMMQREEFKRLNDLCDKLEFKTVALNIDPEEMIIAMSKDKKAKNGKICFVLVNKIGKAVFVDNPERQLVVEAIKKFT